MEPITARAGEVERPSQISRRTLVQGSAWTIPVIATTVAAPASSASPPCPNIATSAGWTRGGSALYTGGAGAHPFFMNGNSLHQGDDNTSIWEEAWGYGQTSMSVVAGRTYTFRFGIGKTLFNWPVASNQFGQHVFFSVNGQRLGSFFSRPLAGRTTINANLPSYDYHTFTWTATTTGTVPVRFDFALPQRYQGPNYPVWNGAQWIYGGDDVRVTLPTVSTAGCP